MRARRSRPRPALASRPCGPRPCSCSSRGNAWNFCLPDVMWCGAAAGAGAEREGEMSRWQQQLGIRGRRAGETRVTWRLPHAAAAAAAAALPLSARRAWPPGPLPLHSCCHATQTAATTHNSLTHTHPHRFSLSLTYTHTVHPTAASITTSLGVFVLYLTGWLGIIRTYSVVCTHVAVRLCTVRAPPLTCTLKLLLTQQAPRHRRRHSHISAPAPFVPFSPC